MSLTPNSLFSIVAALRSESPLTTTALAQRLRDLKWADVFEDELRGLLTVTSVVRSVGGDAWTAVDEAEVRKEATRLARSAPPAPMISPVLRSALFLEPHQSESVAFAVAPKASDDPRAHIVPEAPRAVSLVLQDVTLGTPAPPVEITPSVRARRPRTTTTIRPTELMPAISSALLASATDGLTCGRCLTTMRKNECRCRR